SQQGEGEGRELLGQGGDGEHRRRRDGRLPFQKSPPVTALVNDLTSVKDGDGTARRVRFVVGGKDLVNPITPLVGERRVGRGTSRHGGGPQKERESVGRTESHDELPLA